MPIGFSLANYVYFKKVRKALGLDNCHFPATGSAPISQDTLTFFMSINIPIHELYGMSETTGPTSMTTSDNIRFRSSGFAINGTDIKIDDVNDSGSGEVCTIHPKLIHNLMSLVSFLYLSNCLGMRQSIYIYN